eukprot:TRINITY_DN561_c0_g5_i3.p1 TRINITY_DN561_c0_g5~~TRINITY_DN561_c0_g5_i3.p1  ORF type:complete len:122 (-),score=29.92 TRINITY_DN561_c0_g5_i3:104-469(-)
MENDNKRKVEELEEITEEENLGSWGMFVPPYIMRRKKTDIRKRRRRKDGIPIEELKVYKHYPGKFCYYCGTTETTEWRRGPDRKNSLCNACGLRFNDNRKREALIPPVYPPHRVSIQNLLN